MAPPYRGTPEFPHGRPDLTGVLLVNLGTPDAPTPAAVRRYLAEFLWDPRVVEEPRLLWWLVLHGVILRLRPRRSALAYTRIWTGEGSPLIVHTRRLAAAVAARARRQRQAAARGAHGDALRAALDRRRDARAAGDTACAACWWCRCTRSTRPPPRLGVDAVAAELARWRFVPELRFVQDYWADPAWVEAVAQSIRARARQRTATPHLLFSFHGIPTRYFRAGDPYYCQCQGSARAIAARLGLAPDRWSVAFQSRVGREPWLEPVHRRDPGAPCPARGIKQVQVVCPGFSVDCLETLEEIEIENRERFLHAGGERFDYVPALNESAAHAAQLAALVRRHAQGWDALDADPAALDAAARGARRAPRRAARIRRVTARERELRLPHLAARGARMGRARRDAGARAARLARQRRQLRRARALAARGPPRGAGPARPWPLAASAGRRLVPLRRLPRRRAGRGRRAAMGALRPAGPFAGRRGGQRAGGGGAGAGACSCGRSRRWGRSSTEPAKSLEVLRRAMAERGLVAGKSLRVFPDLERGGGRAHAGQWLVGSGRAHAGRARHPRGRGRLRVVLGSAPDHDQRDSPDRGADPRLPRGHRMPGAGGHGRPISRRGWIAGRWRGASPRCADSSRSCCPARTTCTSRTRSRWRMPSRPSAPVTRHPERP